MSAVSTFALEVRLVRNGAVDLGQSAVRRDYTFIQGFDTPAGTPAPPLALTPVD